MEFKQAIHEAIDTVGERSLKGQAEEIVEILIHQHRTTQQQFLGVLKLAINLYAQQATYDARNEASVEWAREVAKLPNSDLRFPYI
jgi:hypothetical protein